jgi:hypothetical protein
MIPSERFVKMTSFTLLAVFLVCILTVESHSSAPGSLNSRCPTCVDNNIHFAVDAQPDLTLGLQHTVEYIRPPDLALGFNRSIASLNEYRAPPASFESKLFFAK